MNSPKMGTFSFKYCSFKKFDKKTDYFPSNQNLGGGNCFRPLPQNQFVLGNINRLKLHVDLAIIVYVIDVAIFFSLQLTYLFTYCQIVFPRKAETGTKTFDGLQIKMSHTLRLQTTEKGRQSDVVVVNYVSNETEN